MGEVNSREAYNEIVSELVSDLKSDLEDEESEMQVRRNHLEDTSQADRFAALLNPDGVRVLFLGLNPEPSGMGNYGISIGDLPSAEVCPVEARKSSSDDKLKAPDGDPPSDEERPSESPSSSSDAALKAPVGDPPSDEERPSESPSSSSDAALKAPVGDPPSDEEHPSESPSSSSDAALKVAVGDPPSDEERPVESPSSSSDDALKEGDVHPFWALMQEVCETKEKFFSNSFVHDFCPLSFINDEGDDVNPFDVRIGSKELRGRFEERCIDALVDVLLLLQPEFIVAMGKDANKKAQMALRKCYLGACYGLLDRYEYLKSKSPRVVKIPHPNAMDGRTPWTKKRVTEILKSHGILQIMKNRDTPSWGLPSSVQLDMPQMPDMSIRDSRHILPNPRIPSMSTKLRLPLMSDMSKMSHMPSMQGAHPMSAMFPMLDMYKMLHMPAMHGTQPMYPAMSPMSGMFQMPGVPSGGPLMLDIPPTMGMTPIPGMSHMSRMSPMMGMRPMLGIPPSGGMPYW